MRNIKYVSPSLICIAVLSNKQRPLEFLPPYVLAEFLDTDNIFIDSNLNQLAEYIKSKL